MNAVLAILLAAFGGALIHRGFVNRSKKARLMLVDYRLPTGEHISVNACACGGCKNVIWAQRCEIQPPLFCAYCGQKFAAIDHTDDEGIREFIVTD